MEPGGRDFILAIVEFKDGGSRRVHYVRQPVTREPDFGVTSVNHGFADLLARAEAPRSRGRAVASSAADSEGLCFAVASEFTPQFEGARLPFLLDDSCRE